MTALFRHRLLRTLLVILAGCALLALGATPVIHASHQAGPAYGGTVSIRDAEVPDCLDPQKSAEVASNLIGSEIVDTLVTMDEKGRLRDGLALKWKFSDGGKVITFSLRHGVKFSNGDPFTASDVQASLLRAINPATKSPASGGFLGP